MAGADPFNIQSQWGANWFPGISDSTPGNMPLLQGSPSATFPRIANTPTTDPGGGSSSSAGGSGASNPGALFGMALPALVSLLGSNNAQASKATANADQLTTMAKTLFGQGASLSSEGAGAVAPVLEYLKKV